MNWLQQLLDSSTVPLITAFLLGLVTAISPCPLATNITAIGFIGRDIESRHRIFRNGLCYTAGRIAVYAGIGCVLIPVLREGASIYAFQKIIGRYGELLIAPALLLIGLFMLFGHRLRLPRLGFTSEPDSLKRRDGWGAFLLGILFSLAFCPSSGVLYFGALVPLSASQTGGYLLPVVYAVATSLPVIVAAWILAYGVAGIGRFYHRMQTLQRWMNTVIALLFIAVGMYYAILFWI